jgi:TorA maturation chaperone TorD
MQPEYLMTGNIGSMNTPEELLQAYNALFLFLGGAVTMAPDESGLPHICDSGLLRNLPVESSNKRFQAASRLLRSPCPFKQQCHLAINNNYSSLLATEKEAEAYPAASHWVSSSQSVTEHHHELCKLYNRYGHSRCDTCTLPPDHLGIQLLFANLLIEKYLTEADNEIKAMTGRDLVSFIKNEMLGWLPRWADTVTATSKTKCYTGIAGLIVGGLEDVLDILKDQKLGL